MDNFIDMMVLGSGHSIILPNLPRSVNLDLVNTSNFLDVKEFNNYGLYKSTSSESFKSGEGETDDGFIEPVYRMLSEVIVAKRYNPTDFSTPGVLKNSMYLLKGQTVYTEHNSTVDNQVGAVKDVMWQDAFEQDGIKVPAGINGLFRIDALSNPKLSRGIQMDPPSIHSNSVSVTFEWEPSHKMKDLWEFYEKLGTFDKNGELIRRIVTKIISYSETSLVSHGADPFAQKIIKGGKLNNIDYASAIYYGSMENQELKENFIRRNIYYGDFKSLNTIEDGLLSVEKLSANNHNTGIINNKGNQNSKSKEKMDENQETKDQVKLEELFGTGLLNLKDGEEATIELVLNRIKESQTEITNLKAEVEVLKAKGVIADNYIEKVRNTTLENYKKSVGGEEKADKNIINLISSTSHTGFETLKSLGESYRSILEEKFKLKCSHCGSYDVSRASSSENSESGESNDGKSSNSEPTVYDDISKISSKKLSNK